jgi:hypothetical protein
MVAMTMMKNLHLSDSKFKLATVADPNNFQLMLVACGFNFSTDTPDKR